MSGESIKVDWSRSVHAFQMYLRFLSQASMAFGNEDCERSSYDCYESLYEMGVYPRMPPGALNPLWVVLPLALPNAFQSGSFS
jgi:hypothetical protein